MALYTYGHDKNFLNATSLTRAAFQQLLRRLMRVYHIARSSSRGRPPKLRYHHQDLGLILCFYVGSMENGTLCMLFGVPPSTLSRTLRKAEEALSRSLDGYAPVRIAWPSPSRQGELAENVQQPSNADLEKAMYNGWLHSVFVTGTIYFAGDGCIIWSKHNCPGSWNDSDTSLEFRMKLTAQNIAPIRE
ncbi:hypothetical protein PI125_g3618 [Phytophthora idaei]|nr:hypothetical protein PI125_g3618 [Phytophthora idaei]